MIDREARRQLASAIKRLATGKITNDDYQDLVWEIDWSKDPSVAEISESTYIGFDHPTKTIRYTGKNAWSKQNRRRFAIWLLFLHSDCETKRAMHPAKTRLIRFLTASIEATLTLGTFGIYLIARFIFMLLYVWWWTRPESKKIDEIWPFASREDFELARRRPILGAAYSQGT